MNEIERKDKEYIWHPFTQMQEWVAQPQMIIESAEGIQLVDSEGKTALIHVVINNHPELI